MHQWQHTQLYFTHQIHTKYILLKLLKWFNAEKKALQICNNKKTYWLRLFNLYLNNKSLFSDVYWRLMCLSVCHAPTALDLFTSLPLRLWSAFLDVPFGLSNSDSSNSRLNEIRALQFCFNSLELFNQGCQSAVKMQ